MNVNLVLIKNVPIDAMENLKMPKPGFTSLTVRDTIYENFSLVFNANKESLEKFAMLEKETYYHDLDKLEKMGEEGKDFVKIIKDNIKDFENSPKWWKK